VGLLIYFGFLVFVNSRFQAMVTIDDCECVSRLLRNTISMLCENSVKYSKGLKIEGILAITVDLKTIFIVHVDETLERGDEHVAVVGEARSHASSVSPRTYRPPAAKRLAIMPPPAIRSVELAVPEMPSRSVSTWPVKCSAAADRNPVTFPSAQKLVHTVRGQLVFRGRRVPLVSRGSRVTGPRFPIGRPRLIVPDSHKVKCMPRMPCGPKTIARITFNPSLRSHLPVSPGRSGVLQRLPVQSPKNLSSSNLSQKSQVVARTTLFAPENCKVVASHQTAMSANVVSIDHIPVKQRLAVTLPAQEQKTHRDIERDQSSIQHQSGMQMLAVKHRPLHPDGQKQFIQRSADVLQSPNRNVQQLLEPRLGDQRQLFSTAGRVLTVEQASRGRQPLGQTVHQSLRVPQHSKEQQHRGQRDQLAAHPLQTRHLIHPVFHARASQPVNVVGGQVPSVCLSLRQLQPPSQRVQGKPAICLMEESQHPTNQQLRRTPSLKPSTSDQTVVKQVASEIPDYKRLHSQQMIMEKSVRQLSNAELDGGKPLPTGLCTAQTATVGQPSFCAVNQPHGKKVNVLQSVNQPVTVQSTVASGNHSKPVQPVMVVMTRALNQPLSVKLTSVETTANSFQRINNKLPNTSMQLPLWSLKQMVPQQQGICRQTSLDITGHDNPLLSPITKPEKMPSVGFAKLPQTSVNSAGGLRSISSLLSLQCAQGYPASVQLSTPTTLTSSTVQLPHVSVFSRPATVSYETFLPSLLQEQQMSSDFHMAANQSSCISALNPYQFTQPSSTEPSHSTFAGQPKGTSHLSRSLSLPNPSVSLSPFSPVAPAVAWSGVLVKSVESATVPSRQQLKAQVEFSGNHNLENLYSHQSKTSESQHELMPKTIQQLIMKPQDKGHEVQEQQAPRHNIQQQEVPVQNQLCTASLSQGQQLQHIDKKNKLIQQQYQSCAEPQQQMLSQRQLQTQMPQGQAEMSKMANELSQQCLVPADELPQPYFISGKDTGDKKPV
jgi:hypothetical protein